MVKVYSKSNCPACKQTKSFLETMHIRYEEVNIEENDSNFQEVIDLGYQQVPVVVCGPESWSGHQPSKLMTLK